MIVFLAIELFLWLYKICRKLSVSCCTILGCT